LKRRGYDLGRIARKVAEITGISEEAIFSNEREKEKVMGRSILCYCAARKAGISLRTIVRRFGISGPGVGYTVERGAAIVRENNYLLM
jgi:chromosomal replication initiation ATPase DnaA